MLAVLGGNGAGKSTLLRAASGTLGLHRGSITAGEILVDGQADRPDGPGRDRAPRGGGGAGGRQVFARMTVEENLRAGGLAPLGGGA